MTNLTKYQSQMIIRDAQSRIADNMKRQTELEPQVKDYHEAYVKLKDELDATKEKIIQDNQLLKFASERFNDIKTGKDFRVLRSESHDQMKPRERKKYKIKYKWTELAIPLLRKSNCFLNLDSVWEGMVGNLNLKEMSKGELSKLRWGALYTCIGKSPKFILHKGMVGLAEWKDELPKYYKSLANAV